MTEKNWWNVQIVFEPRQRKLTHVRYYGRTRKSQGHISVGEHEDYKAIKRISAGTQNYDPLADFEDNLMNKRGSVPKDMPPIGRDPDAVFAKRAAIAHHFNRDYHKVVRQWTGPETEDDAEWQMYIDDNGTVYRVNGRKLLHVVNEEMQTMINNALEYMKEGEHSG